MNALMPHLQEQVIVLELMIIAMSRWSISCKPMSLQAGRFITSSKITALIVN
jgi:hypothetical protein